MKKEIVAEHKHDICECGHVRDRHKSKKCGRYELTHICSGGGGFASCFCDNFKLAMTNDEFERQQK